MPELPALLAKSKQAIPKLMSQRVKIHTLHRDSDSLIGMEVVSKSARALLATEVGNNALAVSEMELFGSLLADPAVLRAWATNVCGIAPTEEGAGHSDKARRRTQGGDAALCGSLPIPGRHPGWSWRLAGCTEGLRGCGGARSGSACGLLLLVRRARQAPASLRRRSEAQGRQSDGATLGRSAQSLGRRSRETGERKGRSREVRPGAQARAELEAAQGRARGGGEAEVALILSGLL